MIKQQYCKSHNLDLLTIPYYQINNFEKIIQERLDKYHETT